MLRAGLPAVVLVCLLAGPASAQSWVALDSGTTSTLRALENASFSDLYVVGDGGYVAHSDAARTTWTVLDLGLDVDLFAVQRPASDQIWIGGGDGVVRVKTAATGWEIRDAPTSQRVVLYSRESGCQNALGSAGALFQTCDFGQTWDPLDSGVQLNLRHGAGPVTSTSWIVGDGGTLLMSTDGGDTWTPQDSGTDADLYHVIEAGGGWKIVVGAGGTILRSQDGMSWDTVNTTVTEDLYSASWSRQNANWILAVGAGGTVLRSTDIGATWCRLDAGTTADLYAVLMASNSEYIVAGSGGVLRRTTDAGGECVSTPAEARSFGGWKGRYR